MQYLIKTLNQMYLTQEQSISRIQRLENRVKKLENSLDDVKVLKIIYRD